MFEYVPIEYVDDRNDFVIETLDFVNQYETRRDKNTK